MNPFEKQIAFVYLLFMSIYLLGRYLFPSFPFGHGERINGSEGIFFSIPWILLILQKKKLSFVKKVMLIFLSILAFEVVYLIFLFILLIVVRSIFNLLI